MRGFALSIFAMSMAALALPAAAADGAQFYKGKKLELVISYGAGGGYDTYGRLVAGHIAKHIPGRPTIIVKNMPGAGGLVGANFLYNVAPRNGLVMGEINENAALGQALGTKGIRYDARKFTWIGRMLANVAVIMTWHTSKIKTIDDAFKREVLAAGTGPTSNSVVLPRALNELLGTKFKSITGYRGGTAATLAVQKGEVDSCSRPWAVIKSHHLDWVRDKKINVLLQNSVERHPDLPNVPTIVDLAKTEEQREILSLLVGGASVGRSLMAPPEVPGDRAQILRAAFDATMKDPALLKEAARAKLELNPLPAAKLTELIMREFKASPEVLKKTANLMRRVKGKKKSKKKSKK